MLKNTKIRIMFAFYVIYKNRLTKLNEKILIPMNY